MTRKQTSEYTARQRCGLLNPCVGMRGHRSSEAGNLGWAILGKPGSLPEALAGSDPFVGQTATGPVALG